MSFRTCRKDEKGNNQAVPLEKASFNPLPQHLHTTGVPLVAFQKQLLGLLLAYALRPGLTLRVRNEKAGDRDVEKAANRQTTGCCRSGSG